MTSENWLDANAEALKTFTYTYDSVGNLQTAGDGTSSYSYTYNNQYRLSTSTFTFDGQTAAFEHTYDAVGRQTQSALTLNQVASRTNTIGYDNLVRATSIEPTGILIDSIFAEFDYNTNGQTTQTFRYERDDVTETYTAVARSLLTYNGSNSITSIVHQKPDATSIIQHSYAYDETSNIIDTSTFSMAKRPTPMTSSVNSSLRTTPRRESLKKPTLTTKPAIGPQQMATITPLATTTS